jgi:hypothetical protein
VLNTVRLKIDSRAGYQGARATEFIPVGDDRLVVGAYWIGDDGTPREPLIFHSVEVREGRISHIQDYRTKEGALRQRRRR